MIELNKKSFLFSITEDRGKELEKSLNEAALPGKVVFVKCDVMKEDEIKVWIDTVLKDSTHTHPGG